MTVVTHIVLHRCRAAKYLVWARNLLAPASRRVKWADVQAVQANQGSPVAFPSGLASALVIIADKTYTTRRREPSGIRFQLGGDTTAPDASTDQREPRAAIAIDRVPMLLIRETTRAVFHWWSHRPGLVRPVP
ncbi:hypothetical protein OG894_03525 [Streptomyces sp. NBC_01724]|uniref:hypothetical protein n=1 Tax=unclassified Streptomyces TaxID=2593676 RepID=UPI002E2EBFAF|nr:hypothetical protein [Streptomyces sp. NBC_01724]WTE56204.1 hypothetical protein OG987_39195 [Streptomyces sp. NBC_01620]WTE64279.1 hypothetical protein OG784_38940 [Streptomyces sp. NBC_01617]WTI91563.1 hypothetical protein OHB17_38245 [Streptomyces sp. NBC_00724]